ncbi:hypothetical protein BESB_068830 [Besnoitia besnoiti]|uniref:Transmembrane protein n=1 Tax=Besnoitia besnoiti TaxID=94643 RepID=A0A2A9MHF3_BESBE|nr:hypothetical protein BESB_068830 [Besnoitia besnoiti]PFH34850.1 hypothetical protein BESB_068830 [Besnoitia besnoiti]
MAGNTSSPALAIPVLENTELLSGGQEVEVQLLPGHSSSHRHAAKGTPGGLRRRFPKSVVLLTLASVAAAISAVLISMRTYRSCMQRIGVKKSRVNQLSGSSAARRLADSDSESDSEPGVPAEAACALAAAGALQDAQEQRDRQGETPESEAQGLGSPQQRLRTSLLSGSGLLGLGALSAGAAAYTVAGDSDAVRVALLTGMAVILAPRLTTAAYNLLRQAAGFLRQGQNNDERGNNESGTAASVELEWDGTFDGPSSGGDQDNDFNDPDLDIEWPVFEEEEEMELSDEDADGLVWEDDWERHDPAGSAEDNASAQARESGEDGHESGEDGHESGEDGHESGEDGHDPGAEDDYLWDD